MELKTKVALVVFMLWLVLTSVALYTWALGDYGYFDEHSIWLGEREYSLTNFPHEIPPQTTWVWVHIRDADCRCNRRADSHVESIEIAEEGYLEFSMSRVEAEALGWTVPATPMLIIAKYTQEHLQARYAGPYAAGPLCASENSFIPLVMGTPSTPTLWLNGNVKACRCG